MAASASDRAARERKQKIFVAVGGIIGIMLLWWLGSRLLARTITGPLATLTFHALQFGKGKMTRPIPVVSTDELGRLARTMEQMAERIEHHINQRRELAINFSSTRLTPVGLP